jgi:hypothetical protein
MKPPIAKLDELSVLPEYMPITNLQLLVAIFYQILWTNS